MAGGAPSSKHYLVQPEIIYNLWYNTAFLDPPTLLPLSCSHYSQFSLSPKAGVLIGTLPTEAHGVSGTLYVHDDVTLVIEQFTYDGYAPGEPIGRLECPKARLIPPSAPSPLDSRSGPPAAYPYFYTKGNVPSNTGGGIKM